MRARIVIVGGGVMGVSIAMHAARRTDSLKEPVLLLERLQLGAGSSSRSGAVLRQFYASPVLAGMARDSLRVFATFAQQNGRSVGFQPCGVLTLAAAPDAAGVEVLDETLRMLVSIGVDARRVEAPEIRALAPGILVDDRTVGAFEPGAGFVDPGLAVDAVATIAKSNGAVTRFGVEVLGIRVEEGRVAGVDTSDGPIDCSQLVLAAGPWTAGLLSAIGVELPLSAQRTEQHFLGTPCGAGEKDEDDALLALGSPESSGATRWFSAGEVERYFKHLDHEPDLSNATHPVILDQERGFYTRCESRLGRTRVGRLAYVSEDVVPDPDHYDQAGSAAFAEWAREHLEGRLPIYREFPDILTEAALYTMTPDAQAIIGPVDEVEGLYVVSGFSGHGFKLAPSVGEGVAQMLVGEAVSAFETEFFSPRRFADAAYVPHPTPFGL